MGLEISPGFLRFVEIVKFAEALHKQPFLLLCKVLIPETANYHANVDVWSHPTGLTRIFRGTYQKSVVSTGKNGTTEDPVILDSSPVTA